MFLRPGMDFSLTEMKTLSPLERTRMVEQHLISRDLAKSSDGAVLLSPDQTVGIMMMEEDHYRLQCIKSGFQVDAALKGCQELERMLGRRLEENPVRSAYIITADSDFEQHFGKKAKRRRKLYNGMIPCQVYMYF